MVKTTIGGIALQESCKELLNYDGDVKQYVDPVLMSYITRVIK